MKKNQSFLYKIGGILNTSSETFMLIALIGLFAMPFVIAKNLEPMVRQSEADAGRSTAKITYGEDPAPVAMAPEDATKPEGNVNPNVLGVSTSIKPLNIQEDVVNLKYFDEYKSTPTDNSYSLSVSTAQLFGKIPVFMLTNSSETPKAYRFNLIDADSQSAEGKYVFVDNTQYEANTGSLPQIVNLQPNDAVTFSLMNNKSNVTHLTVTVDLVTE